MSSPGWWVGPLILPRPALARNAGAAGSRVGRAPPRSADPVLLATCLAPACRRELPSPARSATRSRAASSRSTGRVGSVTLAHGQIPGFMPAMTMPFVVLERDAALLQAMTPGQSLPRDARRVRLALLARGARRRAARRSRSRGRAPAETRREPQPGDAVPDAALVDQDGHALRLADYRGGRTRDHLRLHVLPDARFLPVPDDQASPRAHVPARGRRRCSPRETALLSVSFDVEHDRPSVLRALRPAVPEDEAAVHPARLATRRVGKTLRQPGSAGWARTPGRAAPTSATSPASP